MKYLFEEKKTKKVVELERDSITAGQMKEISRDGFRLIGIGGGEEITQTRCYCTAIGQQHFDGLTLDYLVAGYTLTAATESVRVFEKDGRTVTVERI